jgi:hypothetical protein
MLLRSPNQGVMREMVHLQCWGKIRNENRILGGKSERSRPLCAHRNMEALLCLTTRIVTSLRPFSMVAGSALLAAIPVRRKSRSTRLSVVLLPLILRFINYAYIYIRRWKWFPWARRHVSHLPITLFVAQRSFVSYASRREVTNESCQIK